MHQAERATESTALGAMSLYPHAELLLEQELGRIWWTRVLGHMAAL